MVANILVPLVSSVGPKVVASNKRGLIAMLNVASQKSSLDSRGESLLEIIHE